MSRTLKLVQELVSRREALDLGFHEEEEVKTRHQTKLIREGEYAAEVEVDLIENEGDWGPFLSLNDAEKLDRVREALRRGDVDQASRLGKVFRLLPISA